MTLLQKTLLTIIFNTKNMKKIIPILILAIFLSGCTDKASKPKLNTPLNDNLTNQGHDRNNIVSCNKDNECPQIKCIKAPCPEYKCINNECVLEQLKNSSENEETTSTKATYKIEFIANWNNETYPNNYPKDAHFSPFVAYSHNNSEQAKIFIENGLATAGVEDMAETGKIAILNTEIDELIKNNFVHKKTRGKRINSPGKDFSELELTQDYSQITFVSMLAPSPDWFVSNSVNLFENNTWKDYIELDLITYDAGTDDGTKLTSEDEDSHPKQPIKVFSDELQNLGKLILTKVH